MGQEFDSLYRRRWEHATSRTIRGKAKTEHDLISHAIPPFPLEAQLEPHNPLQHQHLVLGNKHPFIFLPCTWTITITLNTLLQRFNKISNLCTLPLAICVRPEDSLDAHGMHGAYASVAGTGGANLRLDHGRIGWRS